MNEEKCDKCGSTRPMEPSPGYKMCDSGSQPLNNTEDVLTVRTPAWPFRIIIEYRGDNLWYWYERKEFT